MEEEDISLWKPPVIARDGGNPEGWDFKSGVLHADKNHTGLSDTWDVKASGRLERVCVSKTATRIKL